MGESGWERIWVAEKLSILCFGTSFVYLRFSLSVLVAVVVVTFDPPGEASIPMGEKVAVDGMAVWNNL